MRTGLTILGLVVLLCSACANDVLVYGMKEEPPTTPDAPYGWTSMDGCVVATEWATTSCYPPGTWIRRVYPPYDRKGFAP